MMPAASRRISPFVHTGALLLLVGFTAPCSAQRVRDLSSGKRIKLVAPAVNMPWSATAIVDSVGEDTLFVRSLSEPPALRSASRVAIPFGAIRRLQVSGGRASRVSRAGRGALWGLAAYAILAGTYIVHQNRACRDPDCFGEGMAWLVVAGGVPYGAGVGAAIGAVLPVERWHRVTLDDK